jgi:hypothetical protein
LLERTDNGKSVVCVYRSVFGADTIVWSFTLDREGKVIDFKPVAE